MAKNKDKNNATSKTTNKTSNKSNSNSNTDTKKMPSFTSSDSSERRDGPGGN